MLKDRDPDKYAEITETIETQKAIDEADRELNGDDDVTTDEKTKDESLDIQDLVSSNIQANKAYADRVNEIREQMDAEMNSDEMV